MNYRARELNELHKIAENPTLLASVGDFASSYWFESKCWWSNEHRNQTSDESALLK